MLSEAPKRVPIINTRTHVLDSQNETSNGFSASHSPHIAHFSTAQRSFEIEVLRQRIVSSRRTQLCVCEIRAACC